MSNTVAVFPDTNIFLHCRPLNELPWRTMAGVSDVEIKIAAVVARELEEKKAFHPVARIRQRAETSLKWLHAALRTQPPRRIADGVSLDFLATEPSSEFAIANGLNLQIADDRLIGSILFFRGDHPNSKCVLVTGDLGLVVKASHFQIEVIEPGNELQLPSEPDVNEKRIKQLEAKLREYELATPILDLRFSEGQKFRTFVLPPPNPFPESENRERVAEIKEKYPLSQPKPKPKPASALISPSVNQYALQLSEEMRKSFQAITDSLRSIDTPLNYDSRLEELYTSYEDYLREKFEFEELRRRTIKIDLVLENNGKRPAEDIRVILHFPDGFSLYSHEEEAPEPPREPEPPSKEGSFFPQLPYSALFPTATSPNFLPRDPLLPRIRKTNSYEVDFPFPKLNHNFAQDCSPLYVAFDSWESAQSFSVEYYLHASNMHSPEAGELHVIIERT